MLVVKGGDLLRELNRVTVGDLPLTGTGDDNLDAIMDVVVTGLSWTHTALGSAPDWQGHLVHESVLNSLVETMDKIGGHFRRETSLGEIRNVTTFFAVSDSGILATTHGDPDALRDNPLACLITDIEVVEESYDLKNRLYLWGVGEGETRLTLAAATTWPDGSTPIANAYNVGGDTYTCDLTDNYIENATSITAYDPDEMAVQFPDVAPLTNSDADLEAAANFLVLAGVEWLRKNSRPYASYRLRVVGLQTVLKVGQTLRVEARRYRDGEKAINIATQLTILEVETVIDALGVRTAELLTATVARWPAGDGEYVARELGRAQVFNAHPQMGPSVDTISYREHLDDDKNATLYFWLGEETTTVASVLVRMRTDPLRSTVAGGASTTTPAGGESTTPGMGTTNHAHALEVTQYSSDVGYPLNYDSTAGLSINNGGSGVTSGGTTTLTDTGHTHTTPNHQHTFTPLFEYGIFDAASNYAATALEYSVNGGAWAAIAAGQAISGASGWYGLDITAAVINADTKRPVAKVNSIAFRVATASKTGSSAQITAQIERRTTIQSISVF